MQTIPRSGFTTITTEGAILPADLLQRIVDGRELAGLRPEDYHLAPNERINEAISRSWNRLLGVWEGFNEQRRELPAVDRGTTLTRDRWLLILLQELGYGRLPFQGSIALDGDDEESARYPISHEYDRAPLHLVTFRQPLDRMDPDRSERFRRSPHSLLQEFLNRSSRHLWGIVSNGLRLRVLRDNASFTRAAYLEFDLEAMMEGELYADFTLLWLTVHQSRLEGEPAACLLEKWSQEAAEQGTRALDSLRDGVQDAIAMLGRGFLAHPANGELRRQLQSGDLSTQDYYRQLLRLVYRLIFLFVAEDRNLLLVGSGAGATGSRELGIGSGELGIGSGEAAPIAHSPLPTPSFRQRYMDHYSVTRLRDLAARRRSGPHPDLYRSLRLVMVLLREGYPALGLPGLGSYLFSERSTPGLDEADIANETLLDAIRALAFTVENRVLRPVDYKNLGAEELGSVYESLLELHPELNVTAATFDLRTAAGSERRTTGSYYTPTSLINSLLDTALEPVVADRLRRVREWGVGSRELGKRREDKDERDSKLSGSSGLAEKHGSGGELLSTNQGLSQGGGLRDDFSDPAGGRLSSGEHSRGVRQGEPRRIHSVPAHRPGFTEGAGDSSAALTPGGSDEGRSGEADPGTMRHGGPDAAGTDSFSAEVESGELGIGSSPHSPLPTPYSPLEQAILSIKVVDPAAGSGHFLIAAANRLARHLARVRTGDEEPSPEANRLALRDVVRHCIYGVDINEMAVELCKVGLWLETLDPGKPLSFLERNIQCGNSLIGATPALLEGGIPDDAFKAITGDDERYCANWRRQNRIQREGQLAMTLNPHPWNRLGNLADAMSRLDGMYGDTLEEVRAQEEAYLRLVQSGDYEYGRLLADAWCAAFVWIKRGEEGEVGSRELGVGSREGLPTPHSPFPTPHSSSGWPYPITQQVLRNLEYSPHTEPKWLKEEVRRLAAEYQFFHWHLAFPHIFGNREWGIGNREEAPTPNSLPPTPSSSGFDVVLGNPPWEHTELKEKEWFAGRDDAIANAGTGAQRKRMIDALAKTNPALHREFEDAKRAHDGISHFVRNSGMFPLCGRGRINTYAIFAELARHVQSDTGRVGVIVPSGIATDDTTKYYFQDIMDRAALISLYDFENRNAIFPGVHRSYKFCLLTLRGGVGNERVGSGGVGSEGVGSRAERETPTAHSLFPTAHSPLPTAHSPLPTPQPAEFVFFALDTADLRDEQRRFTLSAADIALLNPNTRTCPIFRNRRDAELTKGIYRRVPVLIKEGVGSKGVGSGEENPWGISFRQGLFNMTSDSGLFRTREQLQAEGYVLRGNVFVKREGSRELGVGSRGKSDNPIPHSPFPTPHSPLPTPYLPLYEAKMLHHFDHRWATYEGLETRDVTPAEKNDPAYSVLPRYWVREEEVNSRLAGDRRWLIGFRDIARSTDERTAIFSILPRVAAGHTAPLIFLETWQAANSLLFVANTDGLVFDYSTRQKVGGTHLTYGYLKQLPVLPPQTYHQPCPWAAPHSPLPIPHSLTPHSPFPTPYSLWLLPRILELTYTAYDLRPFAQDCGYDGPPFRWNEERRFLLRCELDAAFFHLYGIAREDVDYIMDTFPIVRRKDEAAYGEYRTKRVILEMYDEMAGVMGNREWGVGSGEERPTPHSLHPTPYQTRLDPPPAHPDAAHPWDEKYLGPELPREQWWKEGSGEWGIGSGGDGEPVMFASEEEAAQAEQAFLIDAALRFNGYDYMEDTGFDGLSARERYYNRRDLPDNPLQRMTILFLIQRHTKTGMVALNDPVYAAFRELVQLAAPLDVPDRYRDDETHRHWQSKYARELPRWLAFIARIHAAMPYDVNASVFEGASLSAAYSSVTAGATAPDSKPIPHSPLPTPFSPPSGSYAQRLKRVMALGQPKSRAELQELVAALGDESENIRWLAGSTLVRIGGPAVREMLAAYLATEPGDIARAEVERVLSLIEEVS